jgi:short-subunit dehydrogenase
MYLRDNDSSPAYLITGVTSGIGKYLTQVLDNNGCKLILIARSSEKLNELSYTLKGNHEYLAIDLTNTDELSHALKDRKDKIKGFVHCAGSESVVPLRQVSYVKFDYLMKLHLYSFVEIIKYIERNKSNSDNFLTSVVAISSIASHSGGIGQTMYAASKSALESAVRILSKELANKKIRLNTILPGIVNTEMTERWRRKLGITNPEDLNKLQLNGIAETNDIVSLIQFLLSDESKQICGTEIKIDGGGPINKYF